MSTRDLPLDAKDIPGIISAMTEGDIDAMLQESVEAMLDAGCRVIQDRIGQTDGGWADIHFTNDKWDVIKEMMRLYFISEKDMAA